MTSRKIHLKQKTVQFFQTIYVIFKTIICKISVGFSQIQERGRKKIGKKVDALLFFACISHVVNLPREEKVERNFHRPKPNSKICFLLLFFLFMGNIAWDRGKKGICYWQPACTKFVVALWIYNVIRPSGAKNLFDYSKNILKLDYFAEGVLQSWGRRGEMVRLAKDKKTLLNNFRKIVP